jgi:hypothetical protein
MTALTRQVKALATPEVVKGKSCRINLAFVRRGLKNQIRDFARMRQQR